MRAPDLTGDFGAAWRITARAGVDQEATIEAWLVSGLWHPAWTFWEVAAVHLRDMPGQSKPATKNFAAATHEFLIASLASMPGTPDVKPDPDLPATLQFLVPPDVVLQFVATDDQAKQLVELAVKAIVLQGLSPDSDYRSRWQSIVPRTLEHIKFGGHPE